MKHCALISFAFLLLLFRLAEAQEISSGLLDDFQDDTTQGWQHGGASPNPPINVPGGGDQGAEDNYLESVASGSVGPGGRQVIHNRDARWTGDWIAANVNIVRVNIANFGDDPVSIRVAIRDGLNQSANCYVSTVPVVKAADFTWSNHEFLIDATTMTSAVGSATFEDVASNVAELRVLSSASGSCTGDRVFSIIAYDDFESDNDEDLDGLMDPIDNCTEVPNPRVCINDIGALPSPAPQYTDRASCQSAGFSWRQPDTDNDLYGNACDFDIEPQPGPYRNGDCRQNFLDLQAVKNAFFSNSASVNWNPNADFDFDGQVNVEDFQAFLIDIFGTVGPGLGNCSCAPKPSSFDPGEDFGGKEMFLRGGLVLDWGAVPKLNNIVNLGDGTYQARVHISAGSYEGDTGYKIADFDWYLAYGNNGAESTVVGVPITLQDSSVTWPENVPVDIAETGCYEINIVPALGDPPSNPAPEIEVTFIGPVP